VKLVWDLPETGVTHGRYFRVARDWTHIPGSFEAQKNPMASQETKRSSVRNRVCAGVLALVSGLLASHAGAAEPADPYDVLTDVLMTRIGRDGKSYAQDETSPAIFSWSEFPFDDRTFKKFDAAMDALGALPQEKIEAYSDVQRALLQRHLWEVFDTTFNWNWWKGDWYWGGRKYFPKTHMDRRKANQPKIASLIRRLALTTKQIRGLPDTLAATRKAGGFATAHDPKDRFQPFLPADLYSPKESSFICLVEDQHPVPASTHTGKLRGRSMFLQFIRLPGGRTETLEYLDRSKTKPEQFPVWNTVRPHRTTVPDQQRGRAHSQPDDRQRSAAGVPRRQTAVQRFGRQGDSVRGRVCHAASRTDEGKCGHEGFDA